MLTVSHEGHLVRPPRLLDVLGGQDDRGRIIMTQLQKVAPDSLPQQRIHSGGRLVYAWSPEETELVIW